LVRDKGPLDLHTESMLIQLQEIVKQVTFDHDSLSGGWINRRISRDAQMRHARIEMPPERVRDFLRRHHSGGRLALFGLVLRDDFRPDSDVDVTEEFHSGHNLGLEFFAVHEELLRIVGRTVDLITPRFLSGYFRTRVLVDTEIQYVAP